MLETPFQDFLVRPALQRALDQFGVLDMKKTDATAVHARTMIVVRGQFALRVKADFIEHPPKEDEAANLLI